MAYADYTFYTDVYYGDQISEEEFPKLSERASDYIRATTQGVSDKVEGRQLDAVKKATCAVAEIIQDENRMVNKTFSEGQSVSSETVGSWSRSFRSTSLSSTELEYLNQRKQNALWLYLSGMAEFDFIFKVRSFQCIHPCSRIQ